MQRLLRWSVAAAAMGALMLALTGSAQAKTCSERLQVCHGYCVKAMGDRPAGTPSVATIIEFMASGCWESKVVARECCFGRQ